MEICALCKKEISKTIDGLYCDVKNNLYYHMICQQMLYLIETNESVRSAIKKVLDEIR